MKAIFAAWLTPCIAFSTFGNSAHAQDRPTLSPIPVEFMSGSRYMSLNMVLSREFAPESRFGLFHLNTAVMDYDDEADNDLTLQSLLFFSPVDKFRITGGVFYGSEPGFRPTIGVQYVSPGKNWFVLLSPRVNIDEEPSYSVFSILKYSTDPSDRFGLYTSLRALNVFDRNGHIRSYQWARVGLAMDATQFGLAVNFDEFGADPALEFSMGLFIRREIF